MKQLDLHPSHTAGAGVEQHEPLTWRLQIPAGKAGTYRLAQLDDYRKHHRSDFPWQPGWRLSLEARVNQVEIQGTWGVGLWNDPFSMGAAAASRRLPCLPNAAWFFFAAPPNWLSLRDDLPAQGFLAATFQSPRLPGWLTAAGLLALPLLALPPTARVIRRAALRLVRQDTRQLAIDPSQWHSYQIEWQQARVIFRVDEECVLDTPIAPLGPLGCVLWIDNQYAAFTPAGRLKFGTLAALDPAWLELKNPRIET